MRVLLYMMRWVLAVFGITTPRPEEERKTAALFYSVLLAMALALALATFFLVRIVR